MHAVREEVNAIWDGYTSGARNQLLALQANQPFNLIFPATTEAFTVYNRASSQVGKVDDEELRRLIIVTYAKAKGLIYSFQLNNQLVKDLMNFEVGYHGPDRAERIRLKVNALVRYSGELKMRDKQVYESLGALVQRADEWLNAKRTY